MDMEPLTVFQAEKYIFSGLSLLLSSIFEKFCTHRKPFSQLADDGHSHLTRKSLFDPPTSREATTHCPELVTMRQNGLYYPHKRVLTAGLCP